MHSANDQGLELRLGIPIWYGCGMSELAEQARHRGCPADASGLCLAADSCCWDKCPPRMPDDQRCRRLPCRLPFPPAAWRPDEIDTGKFAASQCVLLACQPCDNRASKRAMRRFDFLRCHIRSSRTKRWLAVSSPCARRTASHDWPGVADWQAEHLVGRLRARWPGPWRAPTRRAGR